MPTIREVELQDVERISTLTQAVGWGGLTSETGRRLWSENPAVSVVKLPKGWVLEASGRIVGYLGNITRLYRLGERILRTATATSLVVLPEFRGSSLQLLLQFARQSNVDLLLNTTAAPHVSQICEFLKFERIPQRDYNVSHYWVLGSRAFLRAALRKSGWARGSGWTATALAPLAHVYVAARHTPAAVAGGDFVISPSQQGEFGKAFEDLWNRTASESRLLAFRTPATLRWQFGASKNSEWPFVLAAWKGDRLLGYTAVVRQDAHHIDLARARFGDIFVEGDDPAIVQALIIGAIREATRRGAAMIEMVGFPEPIRRAASSLRPLQLVSDSWPFLYRATSKELHESLRLEPVWYASLFDGDGSL